MESTKSGRAKSLLDHCQSRVHAAFCPASPLRFILHSQGTVPTQVSQLIHKFPGPCALRPMKGTPFGLAVWCQWPQPSPHLMALPLLKYPGLVAHMCLLPQAAQGTASPLTPAAVSVANPAHPPLSAHAQERINCQRLLHASRRSHHRSVPVEEARSRPISRCQRESLRAAIAQVHHRG